MGGAIAWAPQLGLSCSFGPMLRAQGSAFRGRGALHSGAAWGDPAS